MTSTTDPEVAYVGALLHLPAAAAADAAGLVADDDLADPRLSGILAAVRHLADTGIAPDPTVVFAHLRGTGAITHPDAVRVMSLLLADLYRGCPLPASVRWYAAAVLNEALRRRAAEAGSRIAQAAETASLSVLLEVVNRETRAVINLDHRRAVAV